MNMHKLHLCLLWSSDGMFTPTCVGLLYLWKPPDFCLCPAGPRFYDQLGVFLVLFFSVLYCITHIEMGEWEGWRVCCFSCNISVTHLDWLGVFSHVLLFFSCSLLPFVCSSMGVASCHSSPAKLSTPALSHAHPFSVGFQLVTCHYGGNSGALVFSQQFSLWRCCAPSVVISVSTLK